MKSTELDDEYGSAMKRALASKHAHVVCRVLRNLVHTTAEVEEKILGMSAIQRLRCAQDEVLKLFQGQKPPKK